MLLTKPIIFLVTGAAPGGDPSEALPLHPPEADGRRAEQPEGDAGGRGREQKERGEAGLHSPIPGQ